MSTTQPIKKIDEIHQLTQFFYEKGEIRNYVLVILGINTALRISDLLQLTWQDVWNFKLQCFKKYINTIERKTGKTTTIYLNCQSLDCLDKLKKTLQDNIYPSEYIFKSRVGENSHIGRHRAYTIIKSACQSLGYEGNISCHSLRKTFGYHAWKQGISPTVIMSIYNHSSMEITKRYLSVAQDDKDEVYKNIKL